MSPNAKVDVSISDMVKGIANLAKMKVPAVVVVNHRGKIQTFGSKHARECLEANQDDLTRALNKDALALCAGETEGNEPMVNLTRELKAVEEVKLPAPIYLMNYSEVIKVLRQLIVFDHNESKDKKQKEIYIKYGEESWEPSFWPNNLWKWENMINFSKLTVQHLRDAGLYDRFRTVVDFLKYVVTTGFEQLELNPDNHISAEFNDVEESKRKKVRRIISSPIVQRPATSSITAAEAPDLQRIDDVPLSEEDFVGGEHYEYRGQSEYVHLEVENSPTPVQAGPSREPELTLENLFSQNENSAEISIPRTALGRVWPNCTVKRNKKGASSVSRAAAQYLGLSEDDHIVWRIKFSLSEKIIGTMQEVDHGYKFPLRLFTETGEVLLSSQAELIKYLRSPACSGLYNIPRVELSALASLIGAQVHVLRPSAGGAGLLNLDHPWDWTTYDPISPQSVDPNGRFYRGSEMYLITEDEVHFFRLSSSDATLPREGAPDVDGTDEAIINEAQEQVEIERFDMVPIATFAKRAEDTDVFVQEPGTNIPVPTELRRSNRKSSRTERYNSNHETREKSKYSK